MSVNPHETDRLRPTYDPAPSLARVLAPLAAKAGIRFNGADPWDIQVYDPRFYRRVLADRSLGLGEAYMDGMWGSGAADETICRIVRADLARELTRAPSLSLLWQGAAARLTSTVTRERAREAIAAHYDIGNELYEAMLDARMNYSCAYYQGQPLPQTLGQAQEAKLDLVCRKIGLQPGQRVLDIGCGWGSFAKFAAERYGARVTGVTLSREQKAWAQRSCGDLPVTIRLCDYRDIEGRFDRIVSIGMFEHVGPEEYRTFFEQADRLLKPGGILLLHCIVGNRSRLVGEAWMSKYVFKKGVLPSFKQIAEASEGLFAPWDAHNFGPDYDRTLMAWFENFDRAYREGRLDRKRYDQRFYRTWKYYLLSCAGLFRAGGAQLGQFVFARPGELRGYRTAR
ncbi:MAG TPA: cyclopropane fatty acyl phospholipid synthase [Candidatus Paceibacterota bacterium]|nr:cyclopropane fatty acyl phospholipid synthase [Candidatus Paceibacterota bacterium]